MAPALVQRSRYGEGLGNRHSADAPRSHEQCSLRHSYRNKPDHGIWGKGQAENYRKRALNRMSAWRYVDFQTALIAPFLFIARCPVEVGRFDVVVSYEDISAFIPEFNVT